MPRVGVFHVDAECHDGCLHVRRELLLQLRFTLKVPLSQERVIVQQRLLEGKPISAETAVFNIAQSSWVPSHLGQCVLSTPPWAAA